MFAGSGTTKRSSNVRFMQIFHELKAQFPTIPDHVISNCINAHVATGTSHNLHDILVAAGNEYCQMGRPSVQLDVSPIAPSLSPQPAEGVMNVSESKDINRNVVKSESAPKRPNTLDINRRLQLSNKCPDVHKLLNSPIVADKPPRSPLSAKRFAAKAPKKDSTPKKETVSTPTQTTDTLLPLSSPINLSLNVNCQMGLVQSPKRCTARVDLTPVQPWLDPVSMDSPRSFTSVNLTLRPPASTPQNPIDITSQNSSLTYSTSSFDREKGLQSRLQITVGPGNTGGVTSVRTRPRSFHVEEREVEEVPVRAGSLNNLSAVTSESPVLLKQQARIDRMKIELETENSRLVILREEVEELEKKNRQLIERRTAEELEKQLNKEIKHLNFKCEQLANLLDKDEFYNNIYTGPTGPLVLTHPPRSSAPPSRPQQHPLRRIYNLTEMQGPEWSCTQCTFLNHPDLDKCEECDMARVYHGTNLDTLRLLPNPNNLSMSYDMFQRSAQALRFQVDNLSTDDMLRRLQSSNNNNNNVVDGVGGQNLTISDMLKKLNINVPPHPDQKCADA